MFHTYLLTVKVICMCLSLQTAWVMVLLPHGRVVNSTMGIVSISVIIISNY